MIDFDALVIGPCMEAFGEQLKVSYQRKSGGQPFDVDAVFDDAYAGLVINGSDGEPEIGTIAPVVGVRLSQFGATPPVRYDTLTVTRTGIRFEVGNVEPDGKGWALLRLGQVT